MQEEGFRSLNYSCHAMDNLCIKQSQKINNFSSKFRTSKFSNFVTKFRILSSKPSTPFHSLTTTIFSFLPCLLFLLLHLLHPFFFLYSLLSLSLSRLLMQPALQFSSSRHHHCSNHNSAPRCSKRRQNPPADLFQNLTPFSLPVPSPSHFPSLPFPLSPSSTHSQPPPCFRVFFPASRHPNSRNHNSAPRCSSRRQNPPADLFQHPTPSGRPVPFPSHVTSRPFSLSHSGTQSRTHSFAPRCSGRRYHLLAFLSDQVSYPASRHPPSPTHNPTTRCSGRRHHLSAALCQGPFTYPFLSLPPHEQCVKLSSLPIRSSPSLTPVSAPQGVEPRARGLGPLLPAKHLSFPLSSFPTTSITYPPT